VGKNDDERTNIIPLTNEALDETKRNDGDDDDGIITVDSI
jgi:hypothetical protein